MNDTQVFCDDGDIKSSIGGIYSNISMHNLCCDNYCPQVCEDPVYNCHVTESCECVTSIQPCYNQEKMKMTTCKPYEPKDFYCSGY